ncbi:MADS-box protein ZMM17-like [Brachypodium distachyon]|uniref:MADS-box transcription factor 17 n=1 Tax=Brachypodium distachyon TaxID=15368 RepID=I1GW01_BRADI|nr:MADS-box protein ZMM17-like [Brachypodium distachyon]AIG21826.1 MADS-box transcription factor 17 [Brachypodium distachyon]|eukprot:NP_001289801.1 MADS-box protein ZMM17-like [Brachypodium distachyon]
MGRGKVEMKRIDNDASRGVTFSKLRAGLLKKAHELAVLCDAHLGVIVFSSNGKLFDYCSPHTSWSELIQRYESSSTSSSTSDIQLQQIPAEIERLRQERDHLEASLRRLTGEDLSSLATDEELDDLEQQLQSVLGKVRQREDELLTEQLDETRQKVQILEDQNSFLRHMFDEEDYY